MREFQSQNITEFLVEILSYADMIFLLCVAPLSTNIETQSVPYARTSTDSIFKPIERAFRVQN